MTERVLIVGPAWVGDMVMAQSLFTLLCSTRPGVALDVLAPPWTLPLLARMPEVRKAIPLPLKHGELALRQRYRLGRSLREANYQQAIVLPNSLKSAIVPWSAGIPQRTGYRGEMRYGLLNDCRRLEEERLPRMVERFVALGLPWGADLPPIPSPRLVTSPDEQAAALQKYQLDPTRQPVLALCPGAEFGPSKQWPASYFATVARQAIQSGSQVWLFGSAGDRAIAEQIRAETGDEACLNLAGQTTLGEAIDLLSLASSVVTNDSGLMHVAAALGRPLVAVYGSTSPQFTPPLSDGAAVLQLALPCQPCFQRTCPLSHHHCMKTLEPARVLAALAVTGKA